MNVVDLLKKYRSSVFQDENLFNLLCWLHLSGPSTLRDIVEQVSLDEIWTRKIIRDLYKDNLLRTKQGERFALTDFAEIILEAVDVDAMVTPFIVDELASEQTARSIKSYVSWAKDFETDEKSTTVQSLKNLRSFLKAYPEINNVERGKYVWSCVLSPDSRMRSVLRSSSSEPDFINTYFSNTLDENDGFFIVEAKSFSDFLDVNDRYILASRYDDVDDEHTLFSAFRVFNYLASSRRDAALETACAFERHSSSSSSWASPLKRILKRLTSKLDTSLVLDLVAFANGDMRGVASIEEALKKTCLAKQEASRAGLSSLHLTSQQKTNEPDTRVVRSFIATDPGD